MPRHDREVHAWSPGPHLLKRGHEASPDATDGLGTSFGTNFQVETNVEHWAQEAREPDCTPAAKSGRRSQSKPSSAPLDSGELFADDTLGILGWQVDAAHQRAHFDATGLARERCRKAPRPGQCFVVRAHFEEPVRRMHAYGEEGVHFFTKQKSVMQRWPESIGKVAEFAMPTAK